MAARFPAGTVDAMTARLEEMGRDYGLKFGKLQLLSNSRKALEASEYARDQGAFHPFHKAVFKAYFTDGQDIGNLDVLRNIAAQCNLSPDNLTAALHEGRYEGRLYEAQQEGRAYEVTGTPTFIINNRYKVVGAQPIEVFRQVFEKLQAE